jgi:hypothetical protein
MNNLAIFTDTLESGKQPDAMLIGPVMDPQLDPRWCTQSKNAARTATSEGSANGPKQIASKIQLCFFSWTDTDYELRGGQSFFLS